MCTVAASWFADGGIAEMTAFVIHCSIAIISLAISCRRVFIDVSFSKRIFVIVPSRISCRREFIDASFSARIFARIPSKVLWDSVEVVVSLV